MMMTEWPGAAARQPRRPRSLPALITEASTASLPTNFEASVAMLASRPSARQAAQPHARKCVELADFGTIRSRSAIEAQTYDS
jgi:hypothetical protein